MHQLEIQYFFPLVEQIPLDLEYSPLKMVSTREASPWDLISISGTGFTSMNITAANLNLDVEHIEFKMKEEPSFLRKLMYKCLGLKWKVR